MVHVAKRNSDRCPTHPGALLVGLVSSSRLSASDDWIASQVPSCEPSSTTITSCTSGRASANRMTVPIVAASLKHGITTLTQGKSVRLCRSRIRLPHFLISVTTCNGPTIGNFPGVR